MSDEQYLESRGWRKRSDMEWWTDPQCSHCDLTAQFAVKVQRGREKQGGAA